MQAKGRAKVLTTKTKPASNGALKLTWLEPVGIAKGVDGQEWVEHLQGWARRC
jgi:hypothetical protein